MKPEIRYRKLGREKADGLYHEHPPLIEIDTRVKGKLHLETLIHEYFHHTNPKWSESKVSKSAKELTGILWQRGVRFVELK